MAKGLRERHKTRRAAEVLDAADTLFRDQGYEETKIEDIAELASVASATVYNYFKNKPNLLMEITLRHIRAAVPERRQFLESLPRDPTDGIIAFEKLLADQAVRHLTRESWRVVMSAQFVDTDGLAHRTARRLDLVIRRQYIVMLRTYQERGRIAPDIDLSVLCDVLIGIGNAALARLVTSSSMTVDAMREAALPHLRLVLRGVVLPESNSSL
ncbi:TetR/AcrR family transcriptional regulator [Devosia naphthalenivorans]|jgi:AcrR family transcriptional regulator|uniref:TetR/AcrR family transcriptional regulator n=1 Tax=Devosia naphthalenivorans TaxID=2082392 RepID=UPI000D37C43E|nr:TetR/AcrR family transcriptional regulator [Devosia naphthalenivorans]